MQGYPIKVLQYGAGAFLRAFADYYIDILNESGRFKGSVAIIKTSGNGNLDLYSIQDNIYTVRLEGWKNNQEYTKNRIINSINCAIDMHKDYNKYMDLCKIDTLKIILSNTTEAGIVFNCRDKYEDKYNITYPAKLTQFLYNRYIHFNGDSNSGLYILPVELIDDNADRLYDCVAKYIDLWQLPQEFLNYVNNCNYFVNTLVDRIVTGYPDKKEQHYDKILGYSDRLLDIAEPYALWAIEDKGDIRQLLESQDIQEIIYTKDIKNYKTRKVRLLNGAHTAITPIAHLMGYNTVYQCMQDDSIKAYLNKIMQSEIIPTINMPLDELTSFSESVIERFNNPYLEHMLLSISLNSVSKWRFRILPTVIDYYNKTGVLPKLLVSSLAFLYKMYEGGALSDNKLKCNKYGREYYLLDDIKVLNFFNNGGSFKDFIKNVDFFAQDLSAIDGFYDIGMDVLNKITIDTPHRVLKQLLIGD